MTADNYCCAIEHADPSSAIGLLQIEEILRAEGIRKTVATAIIGLFERLFDDFADAESRAERDLFDADDITDALDDLDIGDVLEVVEYGLLLIVSRGGVARFAALNEAISRAGVKVVPFKGGTAS